MHLPAVSAWVATVKLSDLRTIAEPVSTLFSVDRKCLILPVTRDTSVSSWSIISGIGTNSLPPVIKCKAFLPSLFIPCWINTLYHMRTTFENNSNIVAKRQFSHNEQVLPNEFKSIK